MKLSGIIWMEDIVDKLWSKHAIHTSEVEELLDATPLYRFVERGYRQEEGVYAAFGRTDAGRYLVVIFVYKADRRALVVSARDMTRAERRRYEKR